MGVALFVAAAFAQVPPAFAQIPAGASGSVVVALDGRPLTHHGYAIKGHVYADVVDLTRTFNGLLTYYKGGGVKLNIGGSMATFYPGRTDGLYNGRPVLYPAAPFTVVSGGDLYVPLYIVVELAQVQLRYNAARKYANIRTGEAPNFVGSHSAGSPAASLRVVPVGTIAADGLHMSAGLTNVTGKPYSITFPSSQELVFSVMRDGVEVYRSSTNKVALQTMTTLTFAPHETKTITAMWSGFANAGPGRYQLRAILMTTPPTVSSATSIGVVTPAPNAAAT